MALPDQLFLSKKMYDAAVVISVRPEGAIREPAGSINMKKNSAAALISVLARAIMLKAGINDWVDILCERPELVETMPGTLHFSRDHWVRILGSQPGLWKYFRKHFSAEDCADILCERPELIETTPKSFRFSRDSWVRILGSQPGLWKYSPKDFTNEERVDILCKQPELIEMMPERVLFSKDHWVRILGSQPGLWKYSPKSFSNEEWSAIIDQQPQLADKCPWKNLTIPSWGKCLFKYPDLVLGHRPDWQCFFNKRFLARIDSAEILSCNPEIEKMVDFSRFSGSEWETVLRKQPQFIKYCRVKKIFPETPLSLIEAQPELINHFDLNHLCVDFYQPGTSRGSGRQDIARLVNFIKSYPWLTNQVLDRLDEDDWLELVKDHPEYLVIWKGWRYSFKIRSKAFMSAGFLNFAQTGLGSICSNINSWLSRTAGIFFFQGLFRNDGDNDMSTAEFLLKAAMDPENAKKYFLGKLSQENWGFLEGILNLDPEAISQFIPPKNFAFLWCAAAPLQSQKLFLDTVPDPDAWQDRNGNTLLHAALVGAAFDDVSFLLEADNPARARYDYLLERGCDPDRKNQFGFSFNDLLAAIRETTLPAANISSPEHLSGPDLISFLTVHPGAKDKFKFQWDTLQPAMWLDLLIMMRSGIPDFISFCNWDKFTGTDWCELIRNRKEFADRCRWETFTGQDWRTLLLADNSYAGKCNWSLLDPDDWLALLRKDGNYIVYLKSEYIAKPEDLKAIMEIFYLGDCSPSEGPFNENLKDLLPFLILRPMDPANAGRFLKRQYAGRNWDFIRVLYERSPEEAVDMPGKDSIPFFIALSAPDEIYRLFFPTADLNLRDSRGNSLLLPALVHSLCAGTMDRYHDMLSKGFDPDWKNNFGISCNDLIKRFTHTKG